MYTLEELGLVVSAAAAPGEPGEQKCVQRERKKAD